MHGIASFISSEPSLPPKHFPFKAREAKNYVYLGVIKGLTPELMELTVVWGHASRRSSLPPGGHWGRALTALPLPRSTAQVRVQRTEAREYIALFRKPVCFRLAGSSCLFGDRAEPLRAPSLPLGPHPCHSCPGRDEAVPEVPEGSSGARGGQVGGGGRKHVFTPERFQVLPSAPAAASLRSPGARARCGQFLRGAGSRVGPCARRRLGRPALPRRRTVAAGSSLQHLLFGSNFGLAGKCQK